MSAGNELQAMIARARALASESMVSFSPTPSSYIGESSRQTSPVEGAATSPTSPASVPQAWRPLTLDEFDALLAKVEAKDSLLHDHPSHTSTARTDASLATVSMETLEMSALDESGGFLEVEAATSTGHDGYAISHQQSFRGLAATPNATSSPTPAPKTYNKLALDKLEALTADAEAETVSPGQHISGLSHFESQISPAQGASSIFKLFAGGSADTERDASSTTPARQERYIAALEGFGRASVTSQDQPSSLTRQAAPFKPESPGPDFLSQVHSTASVIDTSFNRQSASQIVASSPVSTVQASTFPNQQPSSPLSLLHMPESTNASPANGESIGRPHASTTYMKYYCKYHWAGMFCGNWVWVNKTVCPECAIKGLD